MTPQALAKAALRHGRAHQSTLSDDICFSLAFAKIALWLHTQDEVGPKTASKMREAMDTLVRLWHQEAVR